MVLLVAGMSRYICFSLTQFISHQSFLKKTEKSYYDHKPHAALWRISCLPIFPKKNHA